MPRKFFWQLITSFSVMLSVWSIIQALDLAHALKIASFKSLGWIGILGILSLSGICALLFFVCTWTLGLEITLDKFENLNGSLNKVGWIMLVAVMVVSAWVTLHPYYGSLFSARISLRIFIFWWSIIIGAIALKLIWPKRTWPEAFALVMILFSLLFQILASVPLINNYPFSLGWSESSRYYDASLFFSKWIYGQSVPWPILHPALHIFLAIPFLWAAAPLWVHRLWQVLLSFALTTTVAWGLVSRLKLSNRILTNAAVIWGTIFIFQGQLYLHLAFIAALVVIGFSKEHPKRSLGVLFAASVWAGLSRINWFPVPGLLAALFYFLETPVQSKKNFWQYILWPVILIVAGTLIAFLTQVIYIVISGNGDPRIFYTSLSSQLLWYRLWPNETNPLGILPGALFVSAPIIAILFWRIYRSHGQWHWIRLAGIVAILLTLFTGGLVVSVKIGGGGDLHNLDAYLITLLIAGLYFFFERYIPEDGMRKVPLTYHWGLVAFALIIPAWFALTAVNPLTRWDYTQAHALIQTLQQRASQKTEEGQKVLFISNRHLLALGMIKNIPLVEPYEKDILIEMLMANNENYIAQLKSDIVTQKFALIVADPQKYLLLGPGYSFWEENNLWVRKVSYPLLCYYDQQILTDDVAILTPKVDVPNCPKLP